MHVMTITSVPPLSVIQSFFVVAALRDFEIRYDTILIYRLEL